jgi:DNA end-binding protein Ku
MPKPRARAYWKGHLRLSLVSIPVEIYSAVESQSEITFNEIHKPSGRRVGRKRHVEGVDEVKSSDIVKGVEVEPDHYVLFDPAEIEAVKPESSKTIDLVQFIDQKEIDYRYFERPYFLVPADALAAEGYTVIRDALRKTGKVALAQVSIASREWLVSISPIDGPNGGGLIMEMLRYADELRDPLDYLDEVSGEKPQKEMVDLAVQLIMQKAAPFKPERFQNSYQARLRDLVESKRKGKKIISRPEQPITRGNVVDLMEALRKSVKSSDKAKAKPKSKKSA